MLLLSLMLYDKNYLKNTKSFETPLSINSYGLYKTITYPSTNLPTNF